MPVIWCVGKRCIFYSRTDDDLTTTTICDTLLRFDNNNNMPILPSTWRHIILNYFRNVVENKPKSSKGCFQIIPSTRCEHTCKLKLLYSAYLSQILWYKRLPNGLLNVPAFRHAKYLLPGCLTLTDKHFTDRLLADRHLADRHLTDWTFDWLVFLPTDVWQTHLAETFGRHIWQTRLTGKCLFHGQNFLRTKYSTERHLTDWTFNCMAGYFSVWQTHLTDTFGRQKFDWLLILATDVWQTQLTDTFGRQKFDWLDILPTDVWQTCLADMFGRHVWPTGAYFTDKTFGRQDIWSTSCLANFQTASFLSVYELHILRP